METPLRRPLLVLTLILLFGGAALPASAGGFRLYGSYWDTQDAGDTFGGGLAFDLPLGSHLGLEFRGAYYKELGNEPLEALFENNNPVFEKGVRDIPVEAGLRFDFARATALDPYIAGGLSYHFLDTDFGGIDDEFGWYAGGGVELGANRGAGFFVEALYRKIDGSVAVDPNDIEDIGGLDFEGDVPLDLSGLSINAGIVWRH